MHQMGEWETFQDPEATERPLEPFLKSLLWGSSKPPHEDHQSETHRPRAPTEDNHPNWYLVLLLRVLIFILYLNTGNYHSTM